MIKNICVITGSRAEYGLLQPLMKKLEKSDIFNLQILATGTHLSPEFGLTYLEIEKDGFKINEKIEMLLSADTDSAVVKSMGLGMIGYADALERLLPDMVVILGDRFEAFAAASACYLKKIPIIHLHGGELTEGATDEALRHAITKMSFLHFTSAERYRQRVIQLGEEPGRVFCVGAIGLDNAKNIDHLSKSALETTLGIAIAEKLLLVTFHPVTLEKHTAGAQIDELIAALTNLPKTTVIFTMPNADADGRIITKKVEAFSAANPGNVFVFKSLGQIMYLSLMKIANAVIGNSSSGIIEAPFFSVPTINIGDRQLGRLKAGTVIDVEPVMDAIRNAIQKALSPEFSKWCTTQSNLYGEGDTANKIIDILSKYRYNDSLKKKFYDIDTI